MILLKSLTHDFFSFSLALLLILSIRFSKVLIANMIVCLVLTPQTKIIGSACVSHSLETVIALLG